MAQHSTRLQNLTHEDIIRIGANFENELRNELKAAADRETERKLADQHTEHQKELENGRLDREKLIVEYQEKLKKQSKDFEVRLKKEKLEWRKAIQTEIDEEKDEVRQEMRDSAFRTAREVSSENDRRITSLKKEFEVEKERCIDQVNRESQAQFGQAKAKMVSDLMNAKKEIAKMKYAESERAEYNQELIADIKERCRENFENEKDDLLAEFDTQKFTMLQTQRQLEKQLEEANANLAKSAEEIEAHKRKYVELKNQFQTFVMQSRPDLTEGQIDFMFEF